MIKISSLSYETNNVRILKNISFDLPKTGLVIIGGESGSGKTTLLNCIAGLLPFKGSLNINGVYLENLKQKDKDRFRLNELGFIFQDFKLFEDDIVINNVMFPYSIKHNNIDLIAKRRAKDILHLLGLSSFINKKVNELSGGEKQRVAIARSLINDPNIILADEPTGSLDEANSEIIMNLLKQISSDKLVIVVTHDLLRNQKYADIVLTLRNGELVEKIIQSETHIIKKENIIKCLHSNKKPNIPISFLLKHTFQSIKNKKIRTILCNFVCSLSLIGVGLSISISSTINNTIKSSYSSVIGDNQVIVCKKNINQTNSKIAIDYLEANSIKEELKNYVSDVGSLYITDFNRQFIDKDQLVLNHNNRISLSSFSCIDVNEYYWLDKVNKEIYPERPDELKNDEVVLSLKLSTIHSICYELKIPRNVESLSNYLQNNNIYLYLDVVNNEWTYENQVSLQLKGFILDTVECFYHYNHRWNEYIFEEEMRLPYSYKISMNINPPWTLKKLHYLYLDNSLEEFYKTTSNNEIYNSYIFELANNENYKTRYQEEDDFRNIHEVFLYKKSDGYFSYSSANIFKEYYPVNMVTYGSKNGYAMFPKAMMMGFSKNIYFSSDENTLFEFSESISSLSIIENQSVVLPNNILMGSYTKSLQNGVKFAPIDNKKSDLPLDSIDISSSLANYLNLKKNDFLFLAYEKNIFSYSNESYAREYKYASLKINDIIDDNSYTLFQQEEWSILFFELVLQESAFDLLISSLSFDVKNNVDVDSLVGRLRNNFPNLDINNPLGDLNKSVDEVCNYLAIGIFYLSLIAIVISLILNTLANRLHVKDIRRDIGLSRCIGVSKYQSLKFSYVYSYFISFISFLISSLELFVVNFIFNYGMTSTFNMSSTFSFSITSYLVMFITSFIIATLCAALSSLDLIKKEPLDILK